MFSMSPKMEINYKTRSYTKFILIYFSLVVKQAILAYVNHAEINSWNQSVLCNEGSFLIKEITEAFDGARTKLNSIH